MHPLLTLETNERKNLALYIMLGMSIIFVVYACVGLWLVSSNPHFVFWLAVIAHGQIFSIMAGFVAQLVKRRLSAGKQGISIVDEGVQKEKENELQPEPEVAP